MPVIFVILKQSAWAAVDPLKGVDDPQTRNGRVFPHTLDNNLILVKLLS